MLDPAGLSLQAERRGVIGNAQAMLAGPAARIEYLAR